ncbi:hypothetical protein D3C77_493510 [compost metagenome]
MLQVHGVVIAAVEASVGGDGDAEFMQLAGHLVAYVQRQVFAAVGAIDRQLHLVPGADQAFGDARADPVAAPVHHQYRTPERDFIAQHLPGIDDLQFTPTLEGRPVRLGTGGDDHQVGLFTFHQGAIDPGVAYHLDPGQLHFALQVGAGAAELGTARQQLRQQYLTAQL